MDGTGFEFRQGQEISLVQDVQTCSGGRTQTVRDIVHSPPCSAEVKNEWRYTSTPPVSLHSVDSDKLTHLVASSPLCFMQISRG